MTQPFNGLRITPLAPREPFKQSATNQVAQFQNIAEHPRALRIAINELKGSKSILSEGTLLAQVYEHFLTLLELINAGRPDAEIVALIEEIALQISEKDSEVLLKKQLELLVKENAELKNSGGSDIREIVSQFEQKVKELRAGLDLSAVLDSRTQAVKQMFDILHKQLSADETLKHRMQEATSMVQHFGSRIEQVLSSKQAPIVSALAVPTNLELVLREIERRTRYLEQLDEYLEELDCLKAEYEQDEVDARNAKKYSGESTVQVGAASKKKIIEALKSALELKQKNTSILQELIVFRDVVQRGVSEHIFSEQLDSLTDALPNMFAGPEAITTLTAEKVPGEKKAIILNHRGQGLAKFAEGHGLNATSLLLITLFEALPEDSSYTNGGKLRSVLNVALGAHRAGILSRFGWSQHMLFLRGWNDHPEILEKYLAYKTVGGQYTESSVMMIRTAVPLPWEILDVLSAAEQRAFKEAIITKKKVKVGI